MMANNNHSGGEEDEEEEELLFEEDLNKSPEPQPDLSVLHDFNINNVCVGFVLIFVFFLVGFYLFFFL